MAASSRVTLPVLGIIASGVWVFARPAADDLHRQSDIGERQEDEFVVRLADLRRRSLARRAVVSELVAGRIGLLAAADRFAALDRGRPADTLAVRYLPGATSRERYCRLVINYAAAAVGPQGAAIVEKLRQELGETIRRESEPPAPRSRAAEGPHEVLPADEHHAV
jgi:hypothetical protein